MAMNLQASWENSSISLGSPVLRKPTVVLQPHVLQWKSGAPKEGEGRAALGVCDGILLPHVAVYPTQKKETYPPESCASEWLKPLSNSNSKSSSCWPSYWGNHATFLPHRGTPGGHCPGCREILQADPLHDPDADDEEGRHRECGPRGCGSLFSGPAIFCQHYRVQRINSTVDICPCSPGGISCSSCWLPVRRWASSMTSRISINNPAAWNYGGPSRRLVFYHPPLLVGTQSLSNAINRYHPTIIW